MINNHTFTDLEHLELVANRIAERGLDLTCSYPDWIKVTFACASLGEGAREPYHTICRQYSGYRREECDAKFDNCLRTGSGAIKVATLMQMAKDAGIDITLPRGRRAKSEEKKSEERKNQFQAAVKTLKSWGDWYFNTWTERTEIQKDGGERQPVTDIDVSTYYCRLKELGINVSAKDVEHILKNQDFATPYDPFRDYLEGLPEWKEGDPDYIHDFFVGHMEFGDPENMEFYDLMFHKWFVGMVGLWLETYEENPIVPVLYGEQHIGKTFFVRNILSRPLQRYLFPVSPSARVDKDFEIAMSETPLMFLDEFNINNQTKSDAYKYAATSTKSYVRDSYAHHREMRIRKASLIAATNHEQFIRETEGMRRYLAVNLAGTVNLNNAPLPYDGAYAQAYYLIKHGYHHKPTQEESALITEHNQPYVMNDDVAEVLQTLLRIPEAGEITEAFSAGDILNLLNIRGFRGRAFNTNNIGKAMTKIGFQIKRTRKGKLYLAVVIEPEQRHQQRLQAAADVMKEAAGVEEFPEPTVAEKDSELPF